MSAHNGHHAAPRRGAAVRARDEALMKRLGELGPALDGEPDPTFRMATRTRLVAMAAVRTPEPAARSGARRLLGATAVESAAARWRSRVTAGLAGAAVAVTALAGLVAVSTSAQPGDPLYGLKRGTEQTQLALAGDSSRGQTLLDFASTRLTELDRLLSDGTTALPAAAGSSDDGAVLADGASPELVVETLRTMDAQTTEGASWLTTQATRTGTSTPLDFLAQWSAGQSAALSALVPKVPEGARDAMGNSLALLTEVDARSTSLRDSLSCPAGPATAGTDPLGPIPTACGTQTPPSAEGGTSDPTVPGTDPSSTDLPATDLPAVPTSGVGTDGGSSSSSSGSGGNTGVPTVPGTTVPSVPKPTLPLPSLPLPSVSVSVPGGSNNSGGTSPGASPSTSPPLVSICLGPIVVGSC